MASEWAPDILGHPFQQLTLDLGDDAGGAVATLVRAHPSVRTALVGHLRDVDVLYVHGWSDYFFQTDLARFWTDLGARFYALDLRDYGRSLRPPRPAGYIASLDAYDADIAAALTAMDSGSRRVVLMGHSTGGLTLSLWAARHPGVASAVVLNSPWLELQTGALARQALAPIVQARARFDPLGSHPAVDLGLYTRAQRELGSLPDAPEGWRPERGFPTHPGWLAAVIAGHARVAAGIHIGCPVLVLLSARWASPLSWSPEMMWADTVLVVDDIARAATRIGADVTISRLDGAIHDVFLSAPEPRAAAYWMMRRWLIGGPLDR